MDITTIWKLNKNIDTTPLVNLVEFLLCRKGSEIIKIIIDNNVIERYNQYYFSKHPKAKKKQIDKPRHPSINQWCILPRIQMNALKQKWKMFGIWLIEDLGYTNMKLDNFDIIMTVFFESKRRHDVDNQVPKFLLDSFTESGFIVDDDELHLHSLTLKTGYDKENPRTEINIVNSKNVTL